jgi:tRNA1Val (adenine37-N6)-methyltransferase
MKESQARRKRGETLDGMFDGAVKLFQSRAGYRFSLDALLLAHFATLQPADRVLDLGAGSGVIALILARLHREIHVTAVEVQSALAERAARNVKLNRLESRIAVLAGDARLPGAIAPAGSFDALVCNPPYRRRGSGRISANDERQIARHEIHGELADFVGAAGYLLRAKGRMAAVYWAERTVDILAAMRRAGLEPKRLRPVHSFADREASLVLVEAVKGGRSGVEILAPLIVYRQGKEYGEEVAAMISGRAGGNSQFLSQRRQDAKFGNDFS